MIGQYLPEFAEKFPHKPAVKADGVQVTYGEFYENVKKLQYHMQKKTGTDKGRKVAIFIGNKPAFLEVFLAAASLGWMGVPVDPKWTAGELADILAELQPDLAVFEKEPPPGFPFPSLVYAEVMLTEKSGLHWISHDDWERDFYIGYTSGSSGRPKGYIRNHRSWLESFRVAEEVFSISRDDGFFAPGPFCHSLSLFAAVHALHLGATVYIMESFAAEKAVDLIKKEPITLIYAVPTMIYAIVRECEKRGEQIGSLQKMIVTGAKWETEQKERAKLFFPNVSRYEFYGASELSFITYIDEKGFAENPKSIGRPFPGVDIRIVNDKGECLPPEKTGEVYVKSGMIFTGYYNRPELTEEVFHGGYVTVGDIGFVDEKGYLTLAGRKKNMIISGGLNIYPEEVEEVLRNHPAVKEAVVLGIPDPYWGERLTAFIEWEAEEEPGSLEVHCRRELPAYKCPKEYITVDRFPMTASGKVARNEFQKLVMEKRQAVER